MREPRIMHRDEAIVIIDKPSGWLAHPTRFNDEYSLIHWARDAVGQWVYPIHRLDRGTSGVVVMALSSEMAAALQATFDTAEKIYIALVRGEPREASGLIDHPVPAGEDKARVPAQTHYRLLETVTLDFGKFSLVEARPVTGRYHQIRRHLKHLGHPLIGDADYGRGALNRAWRDRYGLARLALHALERRFVHPNGETLTARAPLPDDFAKPLQQAGFAFQT